MRHWYEIDLGQCQNLKFKIWVTYMVVASFHLRSLLPISPWNHHWFSFFIVCDSCDCCVFHQAHQPASRHL